MYSEDEYVNIGFPYDTHDPLNDFLDQAEHLAMYVIYGAPDFRNCSIPENYPPFYFVGNTDYGLAYGFMDSAILLPLKTGFYGMTSGFVVDFGHVDTRLHAVSEGEVQDTQLVGIGGVELSTFLHSLMVENKRKFEEKNNEIIFRKFLLFLLYFYKLGTDHLAVVIGLIKEKECKVALTLEQAFKVNK